MVEEQIYISIVLPAEQEQEVPYQAKLLLFLPNILSLLVLAGLVRPVGNELAVVAQGAQ